MVEATTADDSYPSVERSDTINFADSIAAHPNGALESRREDISTQNGAEKPYPSEFYIPYLSSLSQTWRKSPSECPWSRRPLETAR